MIFGQDRTELRKMYADAWQKRCNKLPLSPLETQIADIVEMHPEYHQLLEDDEIVDKDFSADTGESNPFLHMSMHIALHEQISTNRPDGIHDCYQKLCLLHGGPHDAEHAMMECLGEALWLAQRNQMAPDETKYLDCLKKIAQIA